ncbi:hypothetical protein HME9304_01864 [Flagellimonas maritima]|uniref:Uncharacterized protein n=1 Tax=Flagellimonas maritima TaxID=1383885 RepID=A0A2Z4LT06_9FLAO|nr:hypothetical protein [Allomuricauda aurantiaca]AWX44859.1 hypothetical protein HME9304_01864 [Allomuricauda aurantiaca]
MKNIVSLIAIAALSTSLTFAQTNESGSMESTTVQTFPVTINGTQKEYSVKVMERRNYSVAFKEEDAGKRDKARKIIPGKVTKLIAVDINNDDMYEHYMVLKYKKAKNQDFKLMPTDNGFIVKVDDKTLEYLAEDDIYIINKENENFFYVDEFKEIG